MTCIRILQMIGSLDIGGSQAMIMNIYRNIDRSKIQFDFIIDRPNERYYENEIRQLGGKIYTLPRFKGYNAVEIKKAWDSFFTKHPEYKILHSHVRSYASIYLPVAKKHGLKTIIHSHSTSNGSGVSSVVKTILQFPLRHQADYLFACSEEAGKWLFGNNVINQNNFYILKNAIDTSKYIYNSQIRREYRKKFHLDDRKTYIHIGRLHPAKNHMFLIDVFTEWLKTNPNDVLLIIGDGELFGEIAQQIQKNDLSHSIIMLGARSDVANLLQASDCFLFPSKWEGLPVSVIEAQASGIPCIISNNVTDEVALTKLVIKLPIDEGVQPWITEMSNISYQRQNVEEKIRIAGYDICQQVRWIEQFYNKCTEQ